MKNRICFLILGAAISTVMAQDYELGVKLDLKAYQATPQVPPIRRDLRPMPTAFSLKNYCPTPVRQGTQSSCVGWALAAARTIHAAVRAEITDTQTINEEMLSPSYLYNQIKASTDCSMGTGFEAGLQILQEQGCDQLKFYPYQCDLPPNALSQQRAAAFKIQNFARLTDDELPEKQNFLLKKALLSRKPVIIGAKCYESFTSASVGKKVWSGVRDAEKGYHALVIVGYDDAVVKGGAFLVLNSWGTAWGQGGFIWVRYADLLDITSVYYLLNDVLTPLKKQPVVAADKKLSGALQLIDNGLREMPAQLVVPAERRDLKIGSVQPTYRLTQSYFTGTEFRILMTNQIPAYVYLLGYGTVTKHVEVLYPFEQTSAYFPFTNSTLMLPDSSHFVALDDHIGKDYLCVLYSTEPLKIVELAQAVENAPFPTLAEKLKSVLAERWVQKGVRFETNRIAFEATLSGAGSIVPILLEIDHPK
jgi:Papain family cysteine protease